jgi:hypothetical protein
MVKQLIDLLDSDPDPKEIFTDSQDWYGIVFFVNRPENSI